MSNLTDAIDDVFRGIFDMKAARFQKQRVTITEPAVGLLGFATMVRSSVIGDYGLVAPTLDGLRAAFKQLHLVEPFDESAVSAVTIVRTDKTQPVQPIAPKSALSDWIPGGARPSIPGVYQREHRELIAEHMVTMCSRWDGTHWFESQLTVEEAAREVRVSTFQYLPWRGLAEAPR